MNRLATGRDNAVPTQLPRLYYMADDGWHLWPTWAQFYYSLGRLAAENSGAGSRLVAAVTVPTRAYAAAFVALGVVAARARNNRVTTRKDEYFRHLSSLPPGTAVFVHRGDTIYPGILVGLVSRNGNQNDGSLIEVKYWDPKRGETTYRAPLSYASKKIYPDENSGAADEGRPVIRTVSSHRFISSILGINNPISFVLTHRMDCLIIGRTGLLHGEIAETCFSTDPNGAAGRTGFLQDIIRVRNFLPPGEPGRAEILSASSRPAAKLRKDPDPPIVVLDSATAVIKWHHLWKTSSLVMVLDRTEPSFRDGVEIVNDLALRSSRCKVDGWEENQVPAGVEAIAFLEAAR